MFHLQTGKSSFVEHRTFLHLYRSFHRLWIFLALMFQVPFLSSIVITEVLTLIMDLGSTDTFLDASLFLNLFGCV